MLFLERKYFLKEIGFWDYSCPRHGSLERYNENDWDILLDDMAQGGFNSLVLGVKWLTTGYRSRFPWLDRDPACSAVKTDNGILHYALNAARARQIKTRLLIVENQFPVKTFGLEPVWAPEGTKEAFGEYFGCYDLDHPGLRERMLEMTDEIVRLFGAETDGFVLELEFGDRDEPHRVDIYNRWARENGRPDYQTIKNIDLQPRSFPFTHWRDFTTQRRIDIFKELEAVIRAAGFAGELSTIAELENSPMAVIGNMNFGMVRQQTPACSLVTYDSIYDRNQNRLATMDFCVVQPKTFGFTVYYLSRGVMPWANDPSVFGPLEEQWKMTLEDAKRFNPDGLWFMGSDCRMDDGVVCGVRNLAKFDFTNGREARLKLLKTAGQTT